jgi:hypothetical protein
MQKTITLLFIILWISYATFAGKEESVDLVIVPKPHEGYEVKDGKVFYRYGKAGLILEPANEETIARYFTERGSSVKNPFLDAGEELSNSTFFLLSLINHSNGSLTFTPGYVALKIKTEASFPIDFTVLLSTSQNTDAYHRKLLENSIFHSPETIQPGDSSTKFLIFPPLPKKEAELKMEFDYLFFETKEMKMAFYFSRLKKGSESKGTIYKER